MKSPIGLKCCADSSAITRSNEESAKGSILAVEFSFDMLPELTEDNCEKLTFTEEICIEGVFKFQIFAGPKIPLPISAITLPKRFQPFHQSYGISRF